MTSSNKRGSFHDAPETSADSFSSAERAFVSLNMCANALELALGAREAYLVEAGEGASTWRRHSSYHPFAARARRRVLN